MKLVFLLHLLLRATAFQTIHSPALSTRATAFQTISAPVRTPTALCVFPNPLYDLLYWNWFFGGSNTPYFGMSEEERLEQTIDRLKDQIFQAVMLHGSLPWWKWQHKRDLRRLIYLKKQELDLKEEELDEISKGKKWF